MHGRNLNRVRTGKQDGARSGHGLRDAIAIYLQSAAVHANQRGALLGSESTRYQPGPNTVRLPFGVSISAEFWGGKSKTVTWSDFEFRAAALVGIEAVARDTEFIDPSVH
jgi:hypothetical protein